MKNCHRATFVTYVCPVLHWLSRIINWLQSHVMHILVITLIGMVVCLLIVGFGVENDMAPVWILGTKSKKEALEFIAFGMGGVVAVIVAAAINRRANAQASNNKLIEKGHIHDRFQHATINLGHKKRRVRITSFYQFYYLAKGLKDGFRESIFDILCAHLRHITSGKFYKLKKDEKEPTDECQALLNILFKSKDQSVFGGFSANLENICLKKMNLSTAHLSRVNLTGADLSYANLSSADFSNMDISNANLSNANLSGADLSNADISDANLSNADLADTNLSRTNILRTNLSHAGLVGTNIRDANLTDVNFSGTLLLGTDFREASLNHIKLGNADIKKPDFRGTKVDGRPITENDIPADKGKYYADWNPPPKKEEN